MSADASWSAKRAVYLVAVQDFVVSQDLIDTVRDFDPTAEVITARDCHGALLAVTSHPRLTLGFVEAGPDRVARAHLDVAIRRRRGRLVLLGDEAEEEWESGAHAGDDWPVLMRPFSTQTVTAMLAAGRCARGTAAAGLRSSSRRAATRSGP